MGKSSGGRHGRDGGGGGDKTEGDGKKTGSVTGIALGEYAPGASARRKESAGKVSMKGKDGKERSLGKSLETLANECDPDDDEARLMPAAPEGSFRRRDIDGKLNMAQGIGDNRPKAQLGIDGKVYDFVKGPDDEDENAD